MPKMYNPDTQEVADVHGNEVQGKRAAGFLPVGNRPEAEYMSKTREELTDDDDEVETPETPETPDPTA